jgi:MSHA biogenesis protein MshQ
MGFYRGPNIVTDGLTFAIDAASERSYPGSGTTAYDLVGSYNGALTNGVGFNSANGGSFTFDGIDDYIPFPGVLQQEVIDQNKQLTISLWIKPDVYGNKMPFSTGQSGNDRIYYWTNGGLNLWRIGNFISTTSTALPTAGTWYNTTVVINQGGVAVYLNGEPDYTGTYASYTTQTMATLGRHGSSSLYSYDGNISSVLIYDGKSLTAAEVKQNYNAIKSRFGL